MPHAIRFKPARIDARPHPSSPKLVVVQYNERINQYGTGDLLGGVNLISLLCPGSHLPRVFLIKQGKGSQLL
jgi:hypothetical protein